MKKSVTFSPHKLCDITDRFVTTDDPFADRVMTMAQRTGVKLFW